MENHIESNANPNEKPPEDKKPVTKKINKKVIPPLLKNRLYYRRKSRIIFIIQALFNVSLAIIAGFFFDCYYNTKDYVLDGDYFWEYYIAHNLTDKAVPLNSMLSGSMSILTFSFNFMNLVVIGLFLIFGGVRERIKICSKLYCILSLC